MQIDLDPVAFSASYLGYLAEGTYLVDGAERVIKTLHGQVGLMLISNGLKEVQRPRLARSAISGYFADIVISGEVGAAKPDARIFDAALQRMGHPRKSDVLMVGDNVGFLKSALDSLFGLLKEHDLLLKAAKEGNVSREIIETVERAAEAADIEYLNEEVPEAVAASLDGVARISGIVRAMKEFSHPGAVDKALCNINKAIETTITVARNEWKYVADMKTDLDPNLPMVPCLVGELNQVILNLIINASHAIADVVGDGSRGQGTITISTTCDHNWAEIRVSDTGGGIPAEIADRIYEPFFTTKDVGKGSGQGLAVARNVIVKKHLGELTYESEDGKGTTFIIKLPLLVPEPVQQS